MDIPVVELVVLLRLLLLSRVFSARLLLSRMLLTGMLLARALLAPTGALYVMMTYYRFACEYDASSDCMWKKPSQITGYNNSLFKFLEI